MSRRPAPAVEPLSRAAWERVEAGLFERLAQGEHLLHGEQHRQGEPLGPPAASLPPAASAPPPRHSAAQLRAARQLPPATPWSTALQSSAALWLGAALTAAAAIALWLRLSEPMQPPALAVAPPTATAPSEPAEAHITTTDAPTRTALGGASLVLGARSEVRVAGSDASGWLVRLARGQVDCEVAPRQGRPPFVVLAGATRVTVVGTRFTVIQDGTGARVHVQEGRVRVASGDEERTLGPGESWPSALAVAAPPAPLPPVLEAAALSQREALPRREALAQRGKARRDAWRSPRASQAERFARAAQLEADDPDGAIALYRRLAAGRSPWAANALYAEARLELERGRQGRAVALLKRYLKRHPRGSNAADVASLLARLAPAASGEPR